MMRALELAAMPASAFLFARMLDLPPIAGVIVLFAAMPTGAKRTFAPCSISGW
ncbi:putative permease [Bradyrhizobium yuanmingense]|uniref:hypothetical protein n=1 Tax=Bradyrhizobium yuanmingense TaxID=108015 RepID=UPI003517AD65